MTTLLFMTSHFTTAFCCPKIFWLPRTISYLLQFKQNDYSFLLPALQRQSVPPASAAAQSRWLLLPRPCQAWGQQRSTGWTPRVTGSSAALRTSVSPCAEVSSVHTHTRVGIYRHAIILHTKPADCSGRCFANSPSKEWKIVFIRGI